MTSHSREAGQRKALNTAAGLTLGVAILVGFGAAIGGVVLVFQSNTTYPGGLIGVNGVQTYPDVLTGVVIIVAGLVQAVVLGLLAQWARLAAAA